MKKIAFIINIILIIIIIACSNNHQSIKKNSKIDTLSPTTANKNDIDKIMLKRALYLIDNLDENTYNILQNWNTTKRGKGYIWFNKNDKGISTCKFYYLKTNNKEEYIRINKKCLMDYFPLTIQIDTSKINGRIKILKRYKKFYIYFNMNGKAIMYEETIPSNILFKKNDPFLLFEKINKLIEKQGITRIKYYKNGNELMEFEFSQGYVLTYVTEKAKHNSFSKLLKERLKNGKFIKKDWHLRKQWKE